VADTIFALSSGAPPAAIAIVRISGPGAEAAAERIAGKLPPPRVAKLRALRDPASGMLLDRALVLRFPPDGSVTGEALVELHLHGGRAVVDAVMAALTAIGGLRPAVAGEFTWRAFENGRIDLVEVEGLSDLLRAETEAQRRAALAIAEGGLSSRIAAWEATILRLSARVEAALDFSDEDDVGDTDPALAADLAALTAEWNDLLSRPPAERLRDGIRVAIAGPPNAGKSTLINVLSGREAAIVAPVAGTTRDVIEVPVAIGGVPFVLIDMAGLRGDSDDEIERIGIGKAQAMIAGADIVLWLGDEAPPARAIWLYPRSDEAGRGGPRQGQLVLSARTGDGMAALIELLVERAGALLPRPDALALSRRQRDAIATCADEISALGESNDPLIHAEHLRRCRVILDALTGRSGTEDMLDALFGTFCIGK
jgi:tRNA modification GTPase